jgi:N-methylhydantoinase A
VGETGERPDEARHQAQRRRRVNVDGAWQDVEVVRRGDLRAGSKVVGPEVVEFPEATCVVRPGWNGVVDEVGNLVLEWRR